MTKKKIRELKEDWTLEIEPRFIHTITDEVINATTTDPEVLKELKKILVNEILEQKNKEEEKINKLYDLALALYISPGGMMKFIMVNGRGHLNPKMVEDFLNLKNNTDPEVIKKASEQND